MRKDFLKLFRNLVKIFTICMPIINFFSLITVNIRNK